MKTKYFHSIYLFIIIVLSILYFQKSAQLYNKNAVIERFSTQLIENESILNEYKAREYFTLWKLFSAYPSKSNQEILSFLVNIKDSNNKTLSYLTHFQDSIKSHKNIYLTDSELDSLKFFLKSNFNTLNNNNNINKSLYESSSKIYKILQNEQYLDSLKYLRHNDLLAEIAFLRNVVHHDMTIILQLLSAQVAS